MATTSNSTHVRRRAQSVHSNACVPAPPRRCVRAAARSRPRSAGDAAARRTGARRPRRRCSRGSARSTGSGRRRSPSRVDDGDQVARVAHERAEARLALAPVHLLGQRGALERERDAGRRATASASTISGESGAGERDDEQAARHRRARPAGARSRVPHRPGTSSSAARVVRSEPTGVEPAAARACRRPRSASSGGVGAAASEHDARSGVSSARGAPRRRRRRRLPAARARPRAISLARRRRDQRGARAAQRALARDRPLVLADEARRRARSRAGTATIEAPMITSRSRSPGCPRATSSIAGAISDAARQEREPQRRSRRSRSGVASLEVAHRRVQRRRAPQQVVADPAGVVDQLVVVGAVEQRVAVGRVRRRAAQHEPRRAGRTTPARRPPSNASRTAAASSRTSPSGYATETRLRERRQRGVVDVRRDQEDPREQRRRRR